MYLVQKIYDVMTIRSQGPNHFRVLPVNHVNEVCEGNKQTRANRSMRTNTKMYEKKKKKRDRRTRNMTNTRQALAT